MFYSTQDTINAFLTYIIGAYFTPQKKIHNWCLFLNTQVQFIVQAKCSVYADLRVCVNCCGTRFNLAFSGQGLHCAVNLLTNITDMEMFYSFRHGFIIHHSPTLQFNSSFTISVQILIMHSFMSANVDLHTPTAYLYIIMLHLNTASTHTV